MWCAWLQVAAAREHVSDHDLLAGDMATAKVEAASCASQRACRCDSGFCDSRLCNGARCVGSYGAPYPKEAKHHC